MKVKILLAVAALSCAPPLGIARNKHEYPNDKSAEFVIEKLDITSLPSAIRPKKENGKKTFTDYGFTAESMDESEATIQAAGLARRLSIKVLDKGPSGIYVCVAQPKQNGGDVKTQSVILLKRKDSNALLKGRDSWREFTSCPVIGGSDKDSAANACGGD